MGKSKGYISLWRDIQNSFLWTDKPFTIGQAWIDLIMLANHTDTEGFMNGKKVIFKRGVVYKSILFLSDRWGWDRKKTRRFLDTLEGEKMATTVTTTKGTTITIVNYGFYQDSGTTDGTTDNSSVGQQLPISNNTNNSNNVNKVNNKRCLGENKNVFLTDEEISKLESEYPDIWRRKLEDLSSYMVMSGKKYNSHYHAIIRFIKNDNEQKGGEVIDSEQRKYKHAEDLL